MRRSALVGVLAALGVAPDALACDLERAPFAIDRPAHEWVAAAPPSLRSSLDETGVAFPSRSLESTAMGRLCPDMVPALVVFDERPEAVFELLIQTGRQSEFMSNLGSIQAVSRAPEDHVDRHDIRILFTRLSYHVRHHWSAPRRRIWWDLSPNYTNDLRRVSGYWELHPYGADRTLGFYGTKIDVGPVIPKRVQASITARSMRTAVANIRRWVGEQNGRRP